MDENKRNEENTSAMSVQDVLDEINSEHFNSDDDLNLDEILAEFSDVHRNESDDLIVEDASTDNTEKVDSKKKDADELNNASEKKDKKKDFSEPKKDKSANKEQKQKSKVSQFAGTFDTFTRSELFEDKSNGKNLETRSVNEIIKENSKISKLLGIRCVFLFILSILSCYLAFCHPLSWFLPKFISYTVHPFRYLFLTAFLQICSMLLSVDVLSRGLVRLCKFKPNAESLITFSSFSTLLHTITIMIAPHWNGWLPYSCISVVGLFFSIYGRWINAQALCRVCKTVKSAKYPSLVYMEEIYNESHIIKQEAEDTKTFISHINDKDASNTFWSFISPIAIVSSLVFAFVASFGIKKPEHFFWVLSGIASVSSSFFTALSFSLPFSVTSKKLSNIGAAVSGWFSATKLSQKANVVVTDRDLFPKGAVTLHGLKILGDFTLEKTVCYAASIISETKSGLSDVFSDLLKSRYGVKTHVSNIKYYETGGVEARISNDVVHIGSAGFMLRSGVRLSEGTNTKNAVFIAVNKQPAGVFNINYKGGADVERALHMLVKKKVPVILAVRDFNLLPMMIESEFDLRDGVLEYPEIEQRLDLSSEEQFVNSDPVAVITRSGLYPLSETILAAKKLRRATIRNICFAALCSMIGILFMFYLMFIQKPILVTPHTVFVYMILWCVPSYLLSIKVKR